MTTWRAAALSFFALGTPVFADDPDAARQSDIIFLGEVHDNPAHHAVQANWISALDPAALVFEMIEPEVAETLTPDILTDPGALQAALDWSGSGWPDFAMYYPIFAAAPGARIYGAAIPRDTIHAVFESDIRAAIPEGDILRFGLNRDLPEPEQAAREDLQFAAHCDALPREMLPGMVKVQRVRDAMLARQALLALRQTGGPVVVITGNGHARLDWGAPATLRYAAPEVGVYSLGQSEAGVAPSGSFDLVLDAQPVDRPDPCHAFK